MNYLDEKNYIAYVKNFENDVNKTRELISSIEGLYGAFNGVNLKRAFVDKLISWAEYEMIKSNARYV